MKKYKNFITFEGIDFSGKSTQINLLLKRFEDVNLQPVLVREPGGTIISEKIRDILLSRTHLEMDEKTEIFLYEAARTQLVHEKILPLLNQGRLVLADRFYDSTTAYQGYGRKLNLAGVKNLNRFATSGLVPFKTFFIDISPETAEKRRKKLGIGEDRLEGSGLAFFERIRAGFLTLCNQEPERFIVINGEREAEIIADEIWEKLKNIWQIAE